MKYFKPSEFACKCGCGADKVLGELKNKLDFARGMANIPFIINSGFRCPIHNNAVGGSKNSSHLYGMAADIHVQTPLDRWTILHALEVAGFTRIGIYPSFLHVDVDLNKPQKCIWVGK